MPYFWSYSNLRSKILNQDNWSQLLKTRCHSGRPSTVAKHWSTGNNWQKAI